jgi:hypothetical protein
MTEEQVEQILKELEMIRKLKLAEMLEKGLLAIAARADSGRQPTHHQSDGAKDLGEEGLKP